MELMRLCIRITVSNRFIVFGAVLRLQHKINKLLRQFLIFGALRNRIVIGPDRSALFRDDVSHIRIILGDK
ncbi:hypothetical protein D1872_294110 [compost metagenome]